MTAASPKLTGKPVLYDPLTGEIAEAASPDWSGKRRSFPAVPSELWRYPHNTVRLAQYKSFEAWQFIAMQILHGAGASFRCMVVFREVFNWKTGAIDNPYSSIARRGGKCSEKTVQRELDAYERLGIIQVEHGWRREGDIRKKTRTIRLAIPAEPPKDLDISDIETDHCGLTEDDGHDE